MSKVIFFGFPGHGHLYPTLPIVKELTRRGEVVVYYNLEIFQDMIEDAGGIFRSFHLDAIYKDHKITDAGGKKASGYDRLLELAFASIRDGRVIVEAILEEVKAEKPDYIVHDSYAYCGKLIARILGIPAISSVTVLAYNEKVVEQEPDRFIRCILRMTPEDFAVKYKKTTPTKVLDTMSRFAGSMLGVPDLKILDVIAQFENLNIVYTSRKMQMQEAVFDNRFKFVGPSIRSVDPGKLNRSNHSQADMPLVYISLGSIFNENPEFFQKCIAGFKDAPFQIIMSIGQSLSINQLGELPANFTVQNQVDQMEILQKAAVFITHGGFNSTSEAIYCHVPLIVFPQSVDQFLVAERVEELALGVYLKHPDFSPQELRAVTESVLRDDSYRKRCEEMAESFRAAGGTQKAVDEILAYVAEQKVCPR